ncbi:MBL fold metallo-hydrolase [Streptomyces sp. DSM 44915]|uniref:MBL fold metallo-hydrolase n=1 Tax=Streptomyces chisholmiae TaxID=3075540 RepID=A0ABU2JNZ7_9ACTN|nr:MBL fold metallo-hydrolase [Streptomyces sp. DSM 44915]MDT0266705.1 MBL fold metallo-hydrolase [Streptomyces sp. DSM 44915]
MTATPPRPSAAPRWTDTGGGTGPLWSFPVGDARVFPLREVDYLPSPTEFFPQLEREPWTEGAFYTREPFLRDGRIVLNQEAHLLRVAGRHILIDAGGGNGKRRNGAVFDRADRPFLEQFARAGVALTDVDTVVFTHLHVDHVGFATSADGAGGWAPTFPNARYLVVEEEFAWWTGPAGARALERTGDYLADSILPLAAAGVLDLVPADHEVAPGVRLVPAFGHTPGNVCVEVESAGQRAVFAGDMLHHGVQLERPEWSIRYCVHAEDSAAQRRALLERVADTGDLLVPAHFPFPAAGRVSRVERGFGYTFLDVADPAAPVDRPRA